MTGSASIEQGVARFASEPGTFISQKGLFSLSIQHDIIPQGFKMSVKLTLYEPKMDPNIHLKVFYVAIQIASITKRKKYKLLPTTLGQQGLNWYAHLLDYSINFFEELEATFIKRFTISIIYKKQTTVSADLIQGPSESLREYLNRFIE